MNNDKFILEHCLLNIDEENTELKNDDVRPRCLCMKIKHVDL